jgi:hypothetical protein
MISPFMKQILLVILSWMAIVFFVNNVAMKFISQHVINGMWAFLLVWIFGDGVILANDLKAATCKIDMLSLSADGEPPIDKHDIHEIEQRLHTIEMKLDDEAKSIRSIKKYIYESENRHKLASLGSNEAKRN